MADLEHVFGTQSSCDLTDQKVFTQHSRKLAVQYTRNIVSIEYVRVKSIRRESPVKLYGTVTVEDSVGIHSVYNRSFDDAESIGPGDYLSLTGPWTEVSGAGEFLIKVHLWDNGDEIANGEIKWHPSPRWIYDFPPFEYVSGENGIVSVAYAVKRKALSARVTVVLINGNGESSPIDVYGTIKATIKAFPYPSRRMLFDKSKDEYEQVHHQECRPLTRPVFPVPAANSHVTIEVDLWDHDSLSPEGQVARGSSQFTSRAGTQHVDITGKCGRVRVFITFD